MYGFLLFLESIPLPKACASHIEKILSINLKSVKCTFVYDNCTDYKCKHSHYHISVKLLLLIS